MRENGKRSFGYNSSQGYGLKRQHVQGGHQRRVPLPIFESSGLLELESHNKEGIQLKHVEPSDAVSPTFYYKTLSIPSRKRTSFRAIVYEDNIEEPWGQYELLEKSSYLIGRSKEESAENHQEQKEEDKEETEKEKEKEKEKVIADIPIIEETCSKQHCAIQFRNVNDKLIPYVIDLDSANGTSLNGVVLPPARYVELKSGDVLRFSQHDDESKFSVVFLAA